MKIGILTLGLYGNYGGGLLQAYALQKVLEGMGHEVITIDYRRRIPFFQKLKALGAFFLKKYFWGERGRKWLGHSPTTKQFIQNNMKMSEPIWTPAKVRDFNKYKFDAFIVGSDQCWRYAYVPHLPTYFFDFLENDSKTKRISYAASFGKSDWDYPVEITELCARLAKKFHAISVREHSGQELCKKYLNVSAEQVLDPTFLITKEKYHSLIRESDCVRKGIGAYILDVTPEKVANVKSFSSSKKMNYTMLAPERDRNLTDVPSVSTFISLFEQSEYIITDSFHGTVFSIIFEKPFVVIGNKKRGNARFESMLGELGLENRLIAEEDLSDERLTSVFSQEIRWEEVKKVLTQKREASLDFLTKALAF